MHNEVVLFFQWFKNPSLAVAMIMVAGGP